MIEAGQGRTINGQEEEGVFTHADTIYSIDTLHVPHHAFPQTPSTKRPRACSFLLHPPTSQWPTFLPAHTSLHFHIAQPFPLFLHPGFLLRFKLLIFIQTPTTYHYNLWLTLRQDTDR